MPAIYVDADACPVKEEVYRVAGGARCGSGSWPTPRSACRTTRSSSWSCGPGSGRRGGRGPSCSWRPWPCGAANRAPRPSRQYPPPAAPAVTARAPGRPRTW